MNTQTSASSETPPLSEAELNQLRAQVLAHKNDPENNPPVPREQLLRAYDSIRALRGQAAASSSRGQSAAKKAQAEASTMDLDALFGSGS